MLDNCIKAKSILAFMLVIVFAVITISVPFVQAASERKTTLEREREIYDYIQENVSAKHAMGVDYKGLTKSEIAELEDIVASVTEGCSDVRDKAFAIYNWIEQNIEYNYERCGNLHCDSRNCPVNDIANTSGTSALMAHHVYKSGLGVCEDYSNLSSVLMKMAGIPTILIANMEGAHAFNAFYDGKIWVFFDATWASQQQPERHFDMTIEYMYSNVAHRLQSLQALDKDGILYDIWFSEEPYCYISGSLSDHKTIRVAPGLYGVRFSEENPVNPVHPDVETVIVEEGVTLIPDNFFKGCVNLKKITFPSTLVKIGSYSFEKCTSLKEFTVPDTVITLGTAIVEYSGVENLKIGSSVSDCPGTSFLNSENLKKVVISEGVEEICYGMFMYCDKIQELHLPSTLKKIGNAAFYGMESIEKIYYNGTREDWRKIHGGSLNAGLSSANTTFLQEPEKPEEPEEPEEVVTPPTTQKPAEPVDREEPKKEQQKEDKEDKKEMEKEDKKSLKNLKKRYNYKGNFKDVATALWYSDYVKKAYEMGIINGSSDTTFSPDDTLTVTAVIKMASVVHYYYNGGTNEKYFAPKGNQKWYEPYVDYARKTFYKDLVINDENARAQRMFVADVFYKCLPSSEYPETRYVESIPDVKKSNTHYKSILGLYKAGVLTGNDDKGTFAPGSYISRSEMAAILARVVDTTLRSNKDLGKKPSTGITDAVWYVPEVTEANPRLYDESNWIKITKIEYEEPMGDYSHEIKSLRCYDRREEETLRGDYVAFRCEIKMTPRVTDSDRFSTGGVIILEDGTQTYEYYYKTSIKDGYYELHLPANMKKGNYEFDCLLGVNGGMTKAKIFFTVK